MGIETFYDPFDGSSLSSAWEIQQETGTTTATVAGGVLSLANAANGGWHRIRTVTGDSWTPGTRVEITLPAGTTINERHGIGIEFGAGSGNGIALFRELGWPRMVRANSPNFWNVGLTQVGSALYERFGISLSSDSSTFTFEGWNGAGWDTLGTLSTAGFTVGSTDCRIQLGSTDSGTMTFAQVGQPPTVAPAADTIRIVGGGNPPWHPAAGPVLGVPYDITLEAWDSVLGARDTAFTGTDGTVDLSTVIVLPPTIVIAGGGTGTWSNGLASFTVTFAEGDPAPPPPPGTVEPPPPYVPPDLPNPPGTITNPLMPVVHPIDQVSAVALQVNQTVNASQTFNSPAAQLLRDGVGRALNLSVALHSTAAGTLRIEYSRDGTGTGNGAWRVQRSVSVASATTEAVRETVPIVAAFYRVAWVSGGENATIAVDAVATH